LSECSEEIGEAGEGAECRSRGSGQAFGEEEREFVQGLGMELREPIFEVAPQSLDGIYRRGIRREEQQGHILRQAESLGFVKGAIVEQQEMEAGGVGGGEVIEEELKALGVEGGQCQKEALSRQWFADPIQREALNPGG
jgi:hypothetical protein